MDGLAQNPHPSPRRRFRVRLAALMRWLHIYLSMFSLAAILFFSVTGITLNHPRWFYSGAGSRTDSEGQVERKWLRRVTSEEVTEPERSVDKLQVVEQLRKSHRIQGALAEFRVDDGECMVTFKGPGYAADAFIDRETGKYRLSETYHGLVAVLNDLHKGRDTGPVWSVLIDVSAALMALVSVTGLVLLFYLKLRRLPGLVVAGLGAAVVVALAVFCAP
ncbi:MAG: PepSY-associated TM helix domain-containing protein [Isosphaeraceae bacterium]|nr:PepSY-associated TM helix domain-containing protein [Isosphaeraceae bacterium]